MPPIHHYLNLTPLIFKIFNFFLQLNDLIKAEKLGDAENFPSWVFYFIRVPDIFTGLCALSFCAKNANDFGWWLLKLEIYDVVVYQGGDTEDPVDKSMLVGGSLENVDVRDWTIYYFI